MSFKNIALVLTASLAVAATGCKKYLDEENLGNRTAETYYNTASGFEDLVKSDYATLRTVTSYYALYNQGTDVYSTIGLADNSGLNLYNNQLNSLNADVDAFYKQLYSSINISNNILYWSSQVTDGVPATIAIRVAEAKALRAYYYYLLVETFGDVPLKLDRTIVANLAFTRTPEKDVYTQIIQDLTDAVAALPATTTDFGRVTKGFAQQLLGKVYLTRGYKTYGSGNTDFQAAASLFDGLITGTTYSLKSNYFDLFNPAITGFQVNPEVIFSVQYSTNTLSNGTGSTLYQLFLWDNLNTGLVGRSVTYGRTNFAASPDPYFFSLFDRTRDSRFSAIAYDVILTQVAGTFNGKTYAVGDTLIYYPPVAFTAAQKAAKNYIVVNPDEYRASPFLANSRSYPQFKKFRDPYVTTYSDAGGARDTYIFRLAETYLLGAEAYLKLGNTTKALQYYNAIRTRAAKAGNNPATGVPYTTELTATSVTIDNILDERARELAGEEFRWYELKRTGKLVERVLLYNDEAKAANAIKPYHTLRPIPQSQIDLNRGAFPQNPGY